MAQNSDEPSFWRKAGRATGRTVFPLRTSARRAVSRTYRAEDLDRLKGEPKRDLLFRPEDLYYKPSEHFALLAMQTSRRQRRLSPARAEALKLFSKFIEGAVIGPHALPKIRELYAYYSIEPNGIRFSNRPPRGLRSRAWGKLPKEITDAARREIEKKVAEFLATANIHPRKFDRWRQAFASAVFWTTMGVAGVPLGARIAYAAIDNPKKVFDAQLNQDIQRLHREQESALRQEGLTRAQRQEKYDNAQRRIMRNQERQRKLNAEVSARREVRRKMANAWFPFGPTALTFAGVTWRQLRPKPEKMVFKQKRLGRRRH